MQCGKYWWSPAGATPTLLSSKGPGAVGIEESCHTQEEETEFSCPSALVPQWTKTPQTYSLAVRQGQSKAAHPEWSALRDCCGEVRDFRIVLGHRYGRHLNSVATAMGCAANQELA
ncbi:hypothetical protein MHYP_G00022730 [Metynnis hypsauchen]